MKIAIFTNNYLPNPYGVSMSIESFRKEFEKRGHNVYIFAPEFKGYIDENPRVRRYPSFDLHFNQVRYPIAIPFSKNVDAILNDLEIDIIHAQHPNLLGWVAKKWAKKKNVPLIFTWHTLYDQYAHFVPILPTKFAAWWSIKNARNFANKSDATIVPTPSVIKIIQDWGVTSKKIFSISSGVDEKIFENSDRNEIRKKYNVTADECLLLLVSRLTAEKNIVFLFESVIEVLLKNKKVKFLIVGGGQEKEDLEEKIKENKLENRVFFEGIVPACEIKNHYAAADIFVHASKSETQGMILTEATYMGLPIVAVNASGAKDIVRNNETGFLVEESTAEFVSAVQKIIDDDTLRTRFGENAKQIAHENYTSSICTAKLLKVYEETIAKKIL